MKELLINWLEKINITGEYALYISLSIQIVILLLAAYLSFVVFRPLFLKIIQKATSKSETKWDDILLKNNFFNRIAHFFPAIVIYLFSPYIFTFGLGIGEKVAVLLEIYFVILFIKLASSFLSSLEMIYAKSEKGKRKSIKGYTQVGKILIYFFAAIIVFSIFSGGDALNIFTGLGAFAAILILVFQDAIKGLASGVQLSANDMVRIGDWVSIPKYGADGNVIEISLTTVKIQNWDKTISMIPSYALISDSFNNWRGMEESGGRRIKRAINIDVNSIHFLTEDEKSKLLEIDLISDYIQTKITELDEHNKLVKNVDKNSINGRKLTNIGTFRKYLEEYIKTNHHINKNMTFMVRQLQSSDKGLPIEIYAFSKVQSWVEYEAIQSDIFDHIFSALQTFNLRIFQNPTGTDFQTLKE